MKTSRARTKLAARRKLVHNQILGTLTALSLIAVSGCAVSQDPQSVIIGSIAIHSSVLVPEQYELTLAVFNTRASGTTSYEVHLALTPAHTGDHASVRRVVLRVDDPIPGRSRNEETIVFDSPFRVVPEAGVAIHALSIANLLYEDGTRVSHIPIVTPDTEVPWNTP